MTQANHRNRMIWTGIVTMLLAAIAPSVVASEPGDASPDANGACTSALHEAQSQLSALAASRPVTALEGSALVDQVAGATCGFSILDGAFPADKAPLAASIRAVTGGDAAPAKQSAPPAFKPGASSGGAGTSSELIDCAESGSGTGSITAKILGIVLSNQPAGGNWQGSGGAVDLTGTAGSVSGNELGPAGGMFVGPAGPLPSLNGNSGATCMKTTTTTVISGHCWWLIIYWSCTSEIKTTVSVTLCGADAFQNLAGLGLLTYDHQFVVSGNPCNLGNLAGLDLDVSPYTDAAADLVNSVIQSVSITTVRSTYFGMPSGSLSRLAGFVSK